MASTLAIGFCRGRLSAYASKGKEFSFLEFVMGTVPDNFLGAFVRGDLLQVVVIALVSRHNPDRNGESRSSRCAGFRPRDEWYFLELFESLCESRR